MKKLLSIAAMTALMTTAANADLMRIEGSVGAWLTAPTGDISYGNNSFDLADAAGLSSTTNMYAWIYLKHPVPIVPNVRLEYANPSFDGTVTSIDWDGKNYANVSNTLSLTQYDAILYYNLLDNTFWTTVDLGLDVKFIEGNYKIDADVANNSASVDQDLQLIMPLAYARGRVQIPVTNIGIEVLARGMSYSGNEILDAEIKLDYTMDFVPVVQPGLELGYRYQQVKIDSSTIGVNANLNTTFSGVYGGIMVRF